MSTFFIYPGTKFQLDPTKDKDFPHIPPFYRHDVTKVGDFFIMGVYGEISHFLYDPTEMLFLVIYKNVDTHHASFSLKKQVIKKLSPKSL